MQLLVNNLSDNIFRAYVWCAYFVKLIINCDRITVYGPRAIYANNKYYYNTSVTVLMPQLLVVICASLWMMLYLVPVSTTIQTNRLPIFLVFPMIYCYFVFVVHTQFILHLSIHICFCMNSSPMEDTYMLVGNQFL